MSLLVTGIALFCLVHLFPSLAPSLRDRLVSGLGQNPYKAVFSLLILGGLVLIVFGWKAAVPRSLYVPPLAPGLLASVLVFVGLVLFFAAQLRGYLKRILRHPQMLGTVLWATAHLLTNGDSRSVILFGGLTVWAALAIVLINRREGARVKPEPVARRKDVIAVVAGIVVYAIVAGAHRWLFGVSPFV